MSSSKDTEKKLNQNIDKASGIAQDNICLLYTSDAADDSITV